jgi:hypothetical protein
VHSIAALTLERYFCLRDNKKSYNDKIKTQIIIIYIIFLWLIAFAFALPKSMSVTQTPEGVLFSTWSTEKNKIYFSVIVILFFVLPYAIIFIFSINILIFLKRWAKNSKKLTNYKKKPKPQQLIETRRESWSRRLSFQPPLVARALDTRVNMIKKRTTCFVLAVAISYLITWSPLWAFQIYDEYSTSHTPYIMIINSIVFVVNYSNGIINPLLFMFLTQNFREYFAKLKHDVHKLVKKSEFERSMMHRANSKKLLNNNNNKSFVLKLRNDFLLHNESSMV